ncbi:hypothetical protein Tco_0671972 [Tanacetum coccineum]
MLLCFTKAKATLISPTESNILKDEETTHALMAISSSREELLNSSDILLTCFIMIFKEYLQKSSTEEQWYIENSMGSVTFRSSKGYITGTGKKELHKVSNTETECLVVSSDFKMPDENQILLKVPRHHNMYSFDMKTPTLAKGFTCLIAKATSDESKLCAGTSQTPNSNASKEKDKDVELIVVSSAVNNTEEKVESRTSSTNSNKEEILTEPQQEKKASSTDTSEDNPKVLAFRRELEEIALKHLGTVSKNNFTSTPSVNTGSEPINTGRLDPDDSPMPELEIFY